MPDCDHEQDEETVYVRLNGRKECRICRRAKHRAWEAKHLEQARARKRRWKRNHPDAVKAQRTRWEEKRRQLREANGHE